MSYPNTGPMPWRDPAVSSSPGVIPRSLPGQENGGYGPPSGPGAQPAGPGTHGLHGHHVSGVNGVNGHRPAPAGTRNGPVALGLLAFTGLIAIAVVVVNFAGLNPPGRAILATATLIFGPGIPAAILLKLPSQLIELVLGIALSLSAAMLLPAAFVEAGAYSAVSTMILLNGATVLLAVPAAMHLIAPQGRR